MKKFSITCFIATFILAFTVFTPSSQASSVPFTDLKNGSDVYNAVSELYNDSIVFGITNTKYYPNQDATRAETAQMIVNALGWEDEKSTNPGFIDVKGNKYEKAIYILANKGVVNVATKFNPNGKLTRSQIAKMLTIAFDLEESTSKTSKFTDVKNAETIKYVNTLVENEITKGRTATLYGPNDNLNRGQLAIFLQRGMSHLDFKIISIE